jgi:Phage integrase, N-terminal SAM-like domain
VILSFFSSQGWQSWGVDHRPVIPEGMPFLIDDDLLLEDGPGAARPAAVVNRWLRELPASGAPAPSSWENYARAVKEWTEFLTEHGVGLFDSRDRLKAGLSRYAEHRAAGPLARRFAATTWAQHMSILSLFYRWALDQGHATAEPFTTFLGQLGKTRTTERDRLTADLNRALRVIADIDAATTPTASEDPS